jgi:mannose-6-phosphate isomerase-like protein (cupin superfamily)
MAGQGRRLILTAALCWLSTGAAEAQADRHLHTGCAPRQRLSEFGCSVLDQLSVDRLPDSPLYWHLDAYPSRAAAAGNQTETSAVVEAHDQVWLLTVAAKDWRPDAIRRVATVGPIAVPSARRYGILFIEGVYTPGVTVLTHKHSGPEAFYVMEGEQCVETPAGVLRARPGEGMVVPADTPMSLRTPGTSPRRVLTLIVHDGDRQVTEPVRDWAPTGQCLP